MCDLILPVFSSLLFLISILITTGKFRIDSNSLYKSWDILLLNISSNIKIYFKNLFIDDKFIGYRIFVIEEKKYTNKEGSEYILLATKNKFVKDFEKFDKRKELLAKLLPKNAIERINENTDVFKINKDLANQQLINQYYISYFEKEDNIFIYNDSISKDTLKSIK